MGEGFFVAAFAGQCIVHISQRDQLCADGDLIALQSIRVAAPIPAFVVPAGDLVGRLQQQDLAEKFSKLCAFVDTPKFEEVVKNEHQRDLLLQQRDYMGEYLNILNQRIKALG